MVRMQERKQERDGDCVHTRALQLLHETLQIVLINGLDHFAGCNHTFANSQSQLIVDQRRRFKSMEIVELRTRLPSDHKHVFKTFRRDQCDTCATTLQQCIRTDRRAVHDLDFRQLCTRFSADTREALLNCE